MENLSIFLLACFELCAPALAEEHPVTARAVPHYITGERLEQDAELC